MDHKKIWEQAVTIVSQMTLEEKASQLRYDAPAIPRLGIPAYNWWNEALHGVARAGTATVFPQAIGLAAMFDTQGLMEIAQVIATEGRAKYNAQSANGDRDIYKGLTFWSPNINIFRDPRWGRGHETYGEDPYLTARLGVAFVKGLQGNGKYLKGAACAKHFAVHSGPEALRHQFDAVASPKDMRETYLPAFEALVKEAKVEAVMGAYNRVNGEPACGSKTLLRDILRDEWGFEGHVVSDCWAIRDFHTNHHVTDTAPESAALALKNGCDLNCGNTYLHLMQAYQEGLVSEEQITLAATRLMATRIKLGLFDENCEYNTISYLECDTDLSDQKALEAAGKSMVLLKNDGLLPLDISKLSTVAVIGPNSHSQACLEGNYNGTSSRYVTFLEGIRAACKGKARVLYSQGCHLYKDRMSNLSLPDDRLAEAVAAAEQADVVILCLGLDATQEGEEGDTGNQYFSGDKNDLELPLSQRKLQEAVIKTGRPVVTLVAAGSALRVTEGNAILYAWYPGQAGGTAAADILFGKVSPSGRLPLTFYHSVEELPDFTDYSMAGRTYRYFTGTPLYPFGYGLSYTRFAYEKAQVHSDVLTVTLRNAGGMDGDEVVQIYIHADDSPYKTPNPKLCAFKRVHLQAWETKTVSLKLSEDAFDVIDEYGERVSGGNQFSLWAGGCQPDRRSAELHGSSPVRIQIYR
jgi:beta-glucosidase